jgi:hypothetical protein
MSEFNSGLLRRCTSRNDERIGLPLRLVSRNDEETELPRSACPLPAATLEHSHRIFPEKKYKNAPSGYNAAYDQSCIPTQRSASESISSNAKRSGRIFKEYIHQIGASSKTIPSNSSYTGWNDYGLQGNAA